MEVEDEELHPIVAKLLKHANSLLETALTCPTGVRNIPALKVTKNPKKTEEERNRAEIIKWANHERRLLNELDNFSSVIERKKTILTAREEEVRTATTRAKIQRDVPKEEENLQQSIAELQDELFTIVDENMRRALLLQQMKYSPIALSCVFPDTQASGADLNDEERKRFELLMRQRDEKSLEFLALHNRLQELQDDIEKLQEKNRVARLQNRDLWDELKRLQEGNEGDEGGVSKRLGLDEEEKGLTKGKKGLEGEFAKKQAMNVVIREVFQALILESGINWAKDPHLRKLMLSLDSSLPAPSPESLHEVKE